MSGFDEKYRVYDNNTFKRTSHDNNLFYNIFHIMKYIVRCDYDEIYEVVDGVIIPYINLFNKSTITRFQIGQNDSSNKDIHKEYFEKAVSIDNSITKQFIIVSNKGYKRIYCDDAYIVRHKIIFKIPFKKDI